MDLWLASLREVTELFEATKEKQDGLQKQLMQREETLRKWVTVGTVTNDTHTASRPFPVSLSVYLAGVSSSLRERDLSFSLSVYLAGVSSSLRERDLST